MVGKQSNGPYHYSGWVLTALLCYAPVFGQFVPATNFGKGIPDFDLLRMLAYLFVMVFVFEHAIAGKVTLLNRWVVILSTYALVVVLSPHWSLVYSYDSIVVQELFNSVILPVLLAVMAIVLFRYDGVVNRYCYHLTLTSIVLSLMALFQFIQGSSVINDQARSMATFNNPNLLAVYLVLSLAVILYATDVDKVGKKIGYLAQICIVLAMFTTISRKGLGTMFITFALYYWVTNRKKTVIVFTFLLAVLAAVTAGFSDFSSRFTADEIGRQFEGKAAMADAGIDMFVDNPIIGLGYKGYYENFNIYLPNSGFIKYDAHNEYVTALANYGVIGFIPFMAVFLYPLLWGWKHFRSISIQYQSERRLRILVGLISLITFMVSQYFAGTLFYQNIVVFLLFANVALMLATPLSSRISGQSEMIRD